MNRIYNKACFSRWRECGCYLTQRPRCPSVPHWNNISAWELCFTPDITLLLGCAGARCKISKRPSSCFSQPAVSILHCLTVVLCNSDRLPRKTWRINIKYINYFFSFIFWRWLKFSVSETVLVYSLTGNWIICFLQYYVFPTMQDITATYVRHSKRDLTTSV